MPGLEPPQATRDRRECQRRESLEESRFSAGIRQGARVKTADWKWRPWEFGELPKGQGVGGPQKVQDPGRRCEVGPRVGESHPVPMGLLLGDAEERTPSEVEPAPTARAVLPATRAVPVHLPDPLVEIVADHLEAKHLRR